jgi:hypothetical protein
VCILLVLDANLNIDPYVGCCCIEAGSGG